MLTNPEEARSDFILAAAVAVFGDLLYRFLINVLPGLFVGHLGVAVSAVLVFALTGLTPLLLARYRGDGLAGFGLDGPRQGLVTGVVLAVPVVAVGVASLTNFGFPLSQAAAGAFGSLPPGIVEIVLALAGLAARFFGALLLFTFLTVKARDGFRRTEVSQLEMLRTFGLGAAAAGLVVGLLLAIGPNLGIVQAFLDALALVIVIVLADRTVEARATTSRATILGPAIVALLLDVALFGGSFLVTLRGGILSAGLVIVLAVLIEGRRLAWAVVPLVAATTLYPSGLSPL